MLVTLTLTLAGISLAQVLYRSTQSTLPPSIRTVRNGNQLTIEGDISKSLNGPILSGHYSFEDNNSTRYFANQFNYKINYGRVFSYEAVESDICIDILNLTDKTSLSSGGELLCSHQSHVGNAPDDYSNITIPGFGFALTEGHKMLLATVSQVYPNQISSARLETDFLAVSFSLRLAISSENNISGTISERSPFRDRSFVADPVRRYAPYTDFMNQLSTPVRIYSIGVFLSSISHYYANRATIEVWKNNGLVFSRQMFTHSPGVSDPPASSLVPIYLTLMPGDNVSARARVATDISQVYDFASFILTNSSLTRVNEVTLFPNYVDLNGDGYSDYVDYDVQHTIWAETTRGDQGGGHDTQFEWARFIPPFQNVTISDKSASRLTIVTANGACLLLERNEAIVHYKFIVHYCNENNVPQPATNDQVVWGDFTGDGVLDRLRIDSSSLTFYVALGGPSGLSKERVWFAGDNVISKIFIEQNWPIRKDVVYTEWNSTPTGYAQDGSAMNFQKMNLTPLLMSGKPA